MTPLMADFHGGEGVGFTLAFARHCSIVDSSLVGIN